MFSATMPTEVERIAQQYLRHPVSIKIGDEESGKNKRIEQIVYFISEGQKKSKLMEQLRRFVIFALGLDPSLSLTIHSLSHILCLSLDLQIHTNRQSPHLCQCEETR
jgi:hypothetical protein